jgi:hypothetical protein
MKMELLDGLENPRCFLATGESSRRDAKKNLVKIPLNVINQFLTNKR